MSQSTTAQAAGSVSFPFRLSFGVGSLGTATVLNSTSILLLFFMTNLLGISPWLGGVLLFVSKIVDIFANPLIGMISDRTQTRIGRRRPYLLAGGFVMTVSFAALFGLPVFSSQTSTALYLLLFMTLLSLSYATFTVPYLAVAAEATDSYHERTRIMAYRVFFILLGTLVGTVVAPAIATPSGVGTRESFQSMGLSLAGIILLASLWCFWGTRRANFHQPDANTPSFANQLRIALANRPFVLLASAKLIQLVGVASVITCALYLTQFVLDISGAQVAIFFLTMTLCSAASVPLWSLISKKSGKKFAYIGAVLIYACSALTWIGVGPVSTNQDFALVIVRAVGLGLGSGGLILMGVSMLPDTIEFDHRTSGARREGVFTGLWSMIEKGATAIGGLLIGLLLDTMGFIKATGEVVAQPESAITGIIIGASVLPAGMMLLSLPLLKNYSLTEEKLAALGQVQKSNT